MLEVELSQLFGTDGIRGIAGQAPLDAPTINSLATALAELIKEGPGPHRVLIGRDTRISGGWIESVLTSRLQRHGLEVHSVRVISTPAIAQITREKEFSAGVVISASHNPAQYNGIKVFSRKGAKLEDELEDRLEARIAELKASLTAESRAPEDFTAAPMDEDPAYAAGYAAHLRESVGIDLQGMRLVVDCAHGANWRIAPRMLEELGAELTLLGVNPDGHNINAACGSMHPDIMCRAVRESQSQVGICFDGDGDRVILADEHGCLVDGDHVLYLLARHSDLSPTSREIVGTVMSNLGLEVALKRLGFSLLRAPVGDKFVYEKMLERGVEIGGEQSGHIILRKFASTGDGLLTALQVLSVVRRQARPLSSLLDEFRKFPQLLLNSHVSRKPPLEEIDGYGELIAQAHQALGEDCRIVIRYSGTEPLLRVMVEGRETETVEREAHRLMATLNSWLT
jgi:phosphoglucosamine mutase